MTACLCFVFVFRRPPKKLLGQVVSLFLSFSISCAAYFLRVINPTWKTGLFFSFLFWVLFFGPVHTTDWRNCVELVPEEGDRACACVWARMPGVGKMNERISGTVNLPEPGNHAIEEQKRGIERKRVGENEKGKEKMPAHTHTLHNRWASICAVTKKELISCGSGNRERTIKCRGKICNK